GRRGTPLGRARSRIGAVRVGRLDSADHRVMAVKRETVEPRLGEHQASQAKTGEGSTRERLVRSAREGIEEGGYAGASVIAIAERAGVAAGTLYRHFPSKAELFVEVFRAAGDEVLAAMEEAAAAPGGFVDRL